MRQPSTHAPSLRQVVAAWGRIGVTGFGGPPAHIALLRVLVVERRGWLSAAEFEDANAACGLLPGPASTQLAIFCAQRVAGRAGAIAGGLAFVLPAVAMVTALAAVFLAGSPPTWVRGAGAGAGAAVAAVAVRAGRDLLRPSLERVGRDRGRRGCWAAYVVVGAVTAALFGPLVVLALLGSGVAELVVRGRMIASPALSPLPLLLAEAAVAATGSLGALAWTALKVGALSYGGGFVIIPLMQHDAVTTYRWMSDAQFLNVVALGQVMPGPVVATVAGVGYAAHGLAGALLASAVAFGPSFALVLVLGPRFERLRESAAARAFLDGAGPAAIGAILGSAVTLATALDHAWQLALLAAAAVAVLVLRRGVVAVLLAAGAVGVVVALVGGPVG